VILFSKQEVKQETLFLNKRPDFEEAKTLLYQEKLLNSVRLLEFRYPI